jgi:hypothetical protein
MKSMGIGQVLHRYGTVTVHMQLFLLGHSAGLLQGYCELQKQNAGALFPLESLEKNVKVLPK